MDGWTVLRVILALAVVLGILWSLRLFLQRWGAGMGSTGSLRVLGGLSLGSGRSLTLVQVGRKVLVLGVADKGLQLLLVVEDPLEVEELGGNRWIPLEEAEAMARRKGGQASAGR
ncbi:MAG: flagellar biosynthetic protein FliO [Bacillota bacterium]|nr:flagellar biosynthetic protein FliO [Bacillota bacterium]